MPVVREANNGAEERLCFTFPYIIRECKESQDKNQYIFTIIFYRSDAPAFHADAKGAGATRRILEFIGFSFL